MGSAESPASYVEENHSFFSTCNLILSLKIWPWEPDLTA